MDQFAPQSYSIACLKNKHAGVLNILLECKDFEIPEFLQEVIAESKAVQKSILHVLRAIMKIQKQQEAYQLSNPDLDHTKAQKIKLLRRVKTGSLYDDYARIKRFMLIYLSTRLEIIEDHFWFYGGHILQHQEENIAAHEKEYLAGYRKLLKKYTRKIGYDLTTNLDPPLKYNVEVTVAKNHDNLLTDKGEVVKLVKGNVLFLPVNLIENLLRRDIVVEIDE